MLHISFISKPIMCKFYFLNPISESQRSQGWSEKERTFVSCIVLHVCFEAFKTIASTHYHQRGVEVAQIRHPHQSGKTSVLHLPLIFVNAKCVLSRRFKITYYSASKDLKLFFFSEGVSDIKSCISFLCCKSNNLEEKFCHVFERAAQTMIIMDQSDSSFS